MATTKIKALFTSMVNAMIMAPNTMIGERRNRRSTIFTPDCTWLISLVMRVIMVEVPALSMLVKSSPRIWSNRACLSLVENPTAALAAKNWAVMEDTSPTTANASRHSPILPMYPTSGLVLPIPLSMIPAITRGTSSSKKASRSLKSGARTHSFLYAFRYFHNLPISTLPHNSQL